MRAPAKIKDWLTDEQMAQWAETASDASAGKRRMAIWLTRRDRLHAREVADRLGVSTQAVWLWIHQYNTQGPDGLERKGRGGRHWGLMDFEQEANLLAPFLRDARAGNPAKPSDIRVVVEKHLDRPVSMSYIYRLLRRHGWAEILAQSHAEKLRQKDQDNFQRLSTPWQR